VHSSSQAKTRRRCWAASEVVPTPNRFTEYRDVEGGQTIVSAIVWRIPCISGTHPRGSAYPPVGLLLGIGILPPNGNFFFWFFSDWFFFPCCRSWLFDDILVAGDPGIHWRRLTREVQPWK
jgi:hypothetical protein